MVKTIQNQKGFTLIELLIVIAIIGILAAIAIPLYKSQSIKARISEVTNAMGYVASAAASYYQETGQWPPSCNGISAILNTMGVALPAGSQRRIDNPTTAIINNRYVISVRMINVAPGNPTIEGQSLTLTADTASDRSIRWVWGGSPGLDVGYIPRNY